MAFWGTRQSHEPLRQYRWFVLFGGKGAIELNANIFALKECSKPAYQIDISEHRLINHTFRYPKNLVWQPINIKMVATRNNNGISLTKIIDDLTNTFGYMAPASIIPLSSKFVAKTPNSNTEQGSEAVELRTGMQQISKYGSYENFNNIEIFQTDVNGGLIEVFRLANPIITNVNYGSLSYASDDFVEITMTITYDHAYVQSALTDFTSELSNVGKSELEGVFDSVLSGLNEAATANRAINRAIS